MARGSQAKSEITKKLLETFEGSFLYNDGKEIRIPMNEDGDNVEIKITLTCAKENVGGNASFEASSAIGQDTTNSTPAEPTAEEVENVKKFINALNL